ncbi:MAG: 50S ribosomal protein L29 [Clostridia bacterium]|nr:50S ribosomal protein L29 [Clostridia bacterium]
MTVKNNRLNDYKKMDEAALVEELKALKSELFKLRLSHAMNGLDNPNKITETKRNIARVNTILTIKKNGGEVVVKEATKKAPAKKAAAKKTTKTAKKEEAVKSEE